MSIILLQTFKPATWFNGDTHRFLYTVNNFIAFGLTLRLGNTPRLNFVC